LLFGRGHHIKDQELTQNLKNMYGYGLEGYGYAGEGFRYPPVQGYYDEPTTIATVKKEGPHKCKEIKTYLPKVIDRWVAAYLLNKRIAARNRWRKYATEAFQQASQKYLADLKAEDPEAYERAIEQGEKRIARKDRIPLPLRSDEGKKLFEALEKL
jgi:histone H3/H4